MHALLLTALLTGATAFGVTGYNNAQPKAINNDNEISKVQRAYYDSSSVAEYGTEAGIYNYTSITFCTLDRTGDSRPYTPLLTEIVSYPKTLVNISGDNYSAPALYYGEAYDTSTEADEVVEQLNSIVIDVYINGVLQENHPTFTNRGTEGGNYNKNLIRLDYSQRLSANDYVWYFDHPAPTMEDGIFEVVGDTLTAMAGTIGVGFTSIIHIFYNEGVTPLGILALITLGVALVWFTWNLVSSLLRQRR